MRDYVNIILERPVGAHHLAFGEYALERSETNITIYVGIGTFGSGGGVVPSGTLEITENGTYNIKLYENVNVNVTPEPPTGELTITANGVYNVADKATVNVNVVLGDNTPVMNLTITPNLTIDYVYTPPV